MSINTSNLSAMLQLNLFKATNSMNLSALRMATGLKINSVGDDASTYMVASGIQQSIRGWQGAQESTQKGINIVNTAKNSLSNMKSILNQLSGIADTALSNTPGTDKAALQEKARELLEQLYSQKNTTRFDGVKIFGEENDSITLGPGTTEIITTPVVGTTTTVGITSTEIVKEVINGLINPVKQMSIEELEAAGYTVITSAADFKTKIEADPSGKFALFGNLDFKGVSHTAIDGFSGELNGNGFAIKNLTMNDPNRASQGLFGILGDNSVVKNLILENSQISGDVGVGALAGETGINVVIDNVAIIGGTITAAGAAAGGLVGGLNEKSTIKNSYSTAVVNGIAWSGGLAGVASVNSKIQNSYATGNVTISGDAAGGLVGISQGTISESWASGDVNGVTVIGGLVGLNDGGAITNTFASGKITAGKDSSGDSYAGGLVGQATAGTNSIINSYATGSVTATGAQVGGLVGTTDGTLSNSYATGAVTAGKNSTGWSYAGGLVGHATSQNTITNSYATGAVTAVGSYVGGFIGRGTTSIDNSYATGKVTVTGLSGSSIGGFGGQVSATNSYATGDVEVISTGVYSRVGGFVGMNISSSSGTYGISNSYATGNVTARGQKDVGGFIGEHSGGVISNSYSKGNVIGGVTTGGFAGWSHGGGEIKNSWTSGDVSAVKGTIDLIESGGFVGTLYQGTISNSYSKGKSSNGGGFARNIQNGGVVKDSYYNRTTNSISVTSGPTTGISGMTNADFALINSKVVNNDLYSPVVQKTDDEVLSSATTIKITTATQFMSLISNSANKGKTFVLMADIDFAGITDYSCSTFEGTLDGNGHTIKNLTTDTGLFANVGLYGVVGDLVLENFNITGSTVGALAGINYGYISNVTVKGGSVSGESNTGGLIGKNTGDSVQMCKSSANVTGTLSTGGLIGNNTGTVSSCSATGNVTQESGFYVGGLIGSNEGSVMDCYTSGGTVFTNSAKCVGGLIGRSSTAAVMNSYSSMTVKAIGMATSVGGLIGEASSEVRNCHFNGNVEAGESGEVGGIAGRLNYDYSIRYSKSSGNITGDNKVGGVVGYAYRGNVYFTSSDANVTGNYDIGGFAGRMEQSIVENSYTTGNVNGSATGLTGGFVGMMGTTSVTRQTYASGTVSGGMAGGYAGNVTGSTITNGYWNRENAGQSDGIYQQSAAAINLNSFTNAQATDPLTFRKFDFTAIWESTGTSPTLREQTGAIINEPPRYVSPIKEGSIANDAGLSSPITYPIGSTVIVSTTQKTFTTLITTTTIGITTTEKIITTITDGTPIIVKNEDKETSIYTSFNSGMSGTTSLDTGMTFGKIYFNVENDTNAKNSKAVIESIMKKINEKENKLNNYLNDLNSAVQLQKDNIKSLDERFGSIARADMDAEEINYTQNQIKIQNISAIMVQMTKMRYAPVLMLLNK